MLGFQVILDMITSTTEVVTSKNSQKILTYDGRSCAGYFHSTQNLTTNQNSV